MITDIVPEVVAAGAPEMAAEPAGAPALADDGPVYADEAAESDSAAPASQTSVTPRSYFPETWLWTSNLTRY